MKVFVLLFVVSGFSIAKERPASRLAAFDQIAKINEKTASIYESPSNGQGRQEPELFEGDIISTQTLKNFLNRKDGVDRIYSPWAKGIIYYAFDPDFNAKGRKAVREAVAQFNKQTYLKWVLRRNEHDYVLFTHGSGCYANVGKQSGEQQISLEIPRCLNRGIAMHEMMHSAGFPHEQSRRDRDDHIRVHGSNINPINKKNFKKYRGRKATTLGDPYDKESIMHYGNYAFSKNGQKTITSLSDPREVLGQRNAFSKIDIQRLNKHYNGPGKMITTTAKKCIDFFKFCPHFKKHCNRPMVFANCKKTCISCSPMKLGRKKAKGRKLAKAPVSNF
eukprot:Seg4360.3 transcript_id=Seg4360.3/GoldUCD/mRNA.D3Y31 product="Zinc metalloproteinase nas-6" protein_id=Seg4360.3/GoldUCD/D3Y31